MLANRPAKKCGLLHTIGKKVVISGCWLITVTSLFLNVCARARYAVPICFRLYYLSDLGDESPFPASPFPSFLRSFLGNGADANDWHYEQLPASTFFSKTLAHIMPGSVVIVRDTQLPGESTVVTSPPHVVAGEDMLLRSARLWALFNASVPLVIVLHSDGNCVLRLPRGRLHHVVYRNTWCNAQHHAWLQSQNAELRSGYASLQSIPFGVAVDGGSLRRLESGRPPLEARTLLFSFRGSLHLHKPSRESMLVDVQSRMLDLQAVTNRVMLGRVSPHPSGVGWRGRFLVDVKGPARSKALADIPALDDEYPSAKSISYLEMLHQSIFALSPPGDLWETYRTWEAIAAGTIPVIIDNATYKACERPAVHMLATVPGVVVLRSWAELPEALAHATADLPALAARQRKLLLWWETYKRRSSDRFTHIVTMMREGNWVPPTSCVSIPLSGAQVLAQHAQLKAYWRRPQPFRDGRWSAGRVFEQHLRNASPYPPNCDGGGSIADGALYTRTQSCVELERRFVEEMCMTPACALPALADFRCD